MFSQLLKCTLCILLLQVVWVCSQDVVLHKLKVELLDTASEPIVSQTLAYPSKIEKDITVSKGKFFRVQFQASLESSGSEKVKLDQAVLLLKDSQGTTTYLPFALKTGLNYKLTIGGTGFPKFIKDSPGAFQLKVLAGKLGAKGLDYDLGSVQFDAPKSKPSVEEDNLYSKLKLIEHKFRQPEQHPNFIVPYLFTAVVALLWVPLLFTLSSLGVNLSKLPTQLSKLPFLACLASYVYLATHYWIGLTLFPAIFAFTLLSTATLVVTKLTFF